MKPLLNSLIAIIAGWFAVALGVVMVFLPYQILIREFKASPLKDANSELTLYSLRASQYVIIGGFVVLYLGLINLLWPF